MSTEVRIQLRRDSANNWQGANPVLAEGEMGIETDTRKFKFGDGKTAWKKLPYASYEPDTPIPTKLSQLDNDCDFITLSDVEAAGFIKSSALADYALKSELPTKTSELENDSTFVTVEKMQEKTGNLEDLLTEDKSTLVAAINELLERVSALEESQ